MKTMSEEIKKSLKIMSPNISSIVTYTKDRETNLQEFYFYVNPSKEKFEQFKEKGICKIDNCIYISDEFKILED